MKRVIVESPYAGSTEQEVSENVDYARRCLLACLRRGEAPLASHLLYTQVLDDNVAEERKMGIAAGLAWLHVADAAVVYLDRGCSRGMRYGIQAHLRAGIPVELRSFRTPHRDALVAMLEARYGRAETVADGHDYRMVVLHEVRWD